MIPDIQIYTNTHGRRRYQPIIRRSNGTTAYFIGWSAPEWDLHVLEWTDDPDEKHPRRYRWKWYALRKARLRILQQERSDWKATDEQIPI